MPSIIYNIPGSRTDLKVELLTENEVSFITDQDITVYLHKEEKRLISKCCWYLGEPIILTLNGESIEVSFVTFINDLVGMRISEHFSESLNSNFKFEHPEKSFAINYKNEMNKKLIKRSIIHSKKARNEIIKVNISEKIIVI